VTQLPSLSRSHTAVVPTLDPARWQVTQASEPIGSGLGYAAYAVPGPCRLLRLLIVVWNGLLQPGMGAL
jgi:hypothetical protein